MKDDQKRAFLAVVLSGIILFGWQYFFSPPTDYSETMKSDSKESPNHISEKIDSESASLDSEVKDDLKLKPVHFIEVSNDKNFYKISNNLQIHDAKSFENNSEFSSYFNTNAFNFYFKFNDKFEKLDFQLVSKQNGKTILRNNEYNIDLTLEINDLGFINYSFKSDNSFSFKITYEKDPSLVEESSFMAFSQPTAFFGYLSSDYTSIPFDSDSKGDKEIKWVSIDNQYHMLATVFEQKIPFIYQSNGKGNLSLVTNLKSNELSFKQIFTRKEYDYLISLGEKLDLSIDFGIWAIIAIPILRGLQFFYSIFPNYGISIIFLTILIRLLTFPLQYKSFKSMKKMQVIQPELAKLREKFKDNPQKMQQETMALFKKSGANPLGGCLPLILQMPIFFAFYRVLYSSVELVEAPFYLWIIDLSSKDPYYVLPLLMAIAMVLNQKLMPTTTTDPVQKKIMLFVPLIFAVFMKDFPAGLTLYIFISTLVGMIQQLYVYKKT